MFVGWVGLGLFFSYFRFGYDGFVEVFYRGKNIRYNYFFGGELLMYICMYNLFIYLCGNCLGV